MLNFATLFSVFVLWIPYSRKIWQGIKFGGLAIHVCIKTTKLKSANFFYACMYVWRYRTIPPNLSPLIVLKTSFWAKPPNLMTANSSGYRVYMQRIVVVHAINLISNLHKEHKIFYRRPNRSNYNMRKSN